MTNTAEIIIVAEEGVLLYSPFVLREYKMLLTAMLNALKSSLSLELYLVYDSTIATYNKESMGCVGPTNVLSFENALQDQDIFFEENILEAVTDVLPTMILSLETAQREAFLYGQKEEEYIQFLLAHGLVHLHGYDHGEEMDALVESCLSF